MPHLLRPVALLVAIALLLVCGTSLGGAPLPLTVSGAIETARIMNNPGALSDMNPDGALSISPDGSRYVLRVLRGDVERDGIWMQLMGGRTRELMQVPPENIASFFSTGLGPGGFKFFGPVHDTSEFFNPIRWLSNERVAFLWTDDQQNNQVVSVDLPTKQVRWLTKHPTPVGSFDVSASGSVVYNAVAARIPRASASLMADGFVVPQSADAYSLFRGDLFSGTAIDERLNTQWFIATTSGEPGQKIEIAGRDIDLHMLHDIRISPDGARAVVNTAPANYPIEWDRYTQRELRSWIQEARRDPRGMMARGVQQMHIVELETGASRPLWDAPMVTVITRAAWSPDGKRLLLAPTYLPTSEPGPGTAGTAVAVLDVESGNYATLPLELPALQPVSSLGWKSGRAVSIVESTGAGTIEHAFVERHGKWSRVVARPRQAAVRVEIVSDLSTPPQVVAIARGERRRLVLDPNPGLIGRMSLGRAELRHGKLSTGDQWSALLFFPVTYQPGKRYPLVIQSVYDRIGEGFTLYGYGSLGPAEIATYPGRILADRNIVVAHLTVQMGSKFNTVEEAQVRQRAFEEVTRALTDEGLVDGNRVGLLGFSRNGFYVEYTLTHSDYPFAAAIAADNFDPSYVSIMLIDDIVSGTAINGGAPFGEGLLRWIQHAPGFNADRVRAPLRKVEQSFGLYGVLLRWEMFSRLRYLGKPVELYVVPDFERGAHNTQNPRQIAALMQGSVDWFDFWLNDYERPDPAAASQYARWRQLRERSNAIKDADD